MCVCLESLGLLNKISWSTVAFAKAVRRPVSTEGVRKRFGGNVKRFAAGALSVAIIWEPPRATVGTGRGQVCTGRDRHAGDAAGPPPGAGQGRERITLVFSWKKVTFFWVSQLRWNPQYK